MVAKKHAEACKSSPNSGTQRGSDRGRGLSVIDGTSLDVAARVYTKGGKVATRRRQLRWLAVTEPDAADAGIEEQLGPRAV